MKKLGFYRDGDSTQISLARRNIQRLKAQRLNPELSPLPPREPRIADYKHVPLTMSVGEISRIL